MGKHKIQFCHIHPPANFPTPSHRASQHGGGREGNFAQFQATALDFCGASHSVPTALAALSTADNRRSSLATE